MVPERSEIVSRQLKVYMGSGLTQEEIDELLAEWESYLGPEPEESKKKKKMPELPECDCDIRILMLKGCQCGGV